MNTHTAWFEQACQPLNQQARQQAVDHQQTLTKPAGSLGQLEDLAIQFAAWQGQVKPQCDKVIVSVFAADHGVCQQGVSAFPQAVTAQMVANFVAGGAAISVLSKQLNADFNVVNMGTVEPTPAVEKLINVQLMPGTQDFTEKAAMSEAVMLDALDAGRRQVQGKAMDLFIGGDMGIGNTTSASAIYSLLLDLPPETTVGPGTGVDKDGLARKRKALYQAFNRHAEHCNTPLDILHRVGGLEIAGLAGAYIACAQQGTPVLIDGFITTAAALIASRINPEVTDWFLFSHESAEPAHRLALESFKRKPLLNLGMRLGEASGAAVAVPIIQAALTLHNNMATFADAGVSE